MSNVEFEPYCKEALDGIKENLDLLTQRYVETNDPPDSYVEAITPLLEQQLKLLQLLKAD